MKTNHKHRCLNCDHTFEGNYCPYCGQAADTHRFQVREMFSTVFQTLWGSDNKFLYTCYNLLRHPGILVREYLLGRRQKYFRPVPMLFFLVAVYAVLTYWIDEIASPYDTLVVASEGMESKSPGMAQLIVLFNSLFQNKVYAALFGAIFCVIPYKFFFRHCAVERLDGTKEPLNLAEHFFALVYSGCINMLLSFFAIPFHFIPNSHQFISIVLYIVPNLICMSMYSQICSIKWLKSAWLNIIASVVSIVLVILVLLFCFGFVYGIENMMK